ncbi:hypothetical protein COHA_005006 [Chlorella ohadii]|uniref:Uncharacterized protein n=1 Tax=Chlorella ohadii TaxID=2649997 RepID=A0AAD5DRY0_9CHLO|nr:hypothetical protein COHA_005006 [Chlorella ohadii]
MRGGDLDTDKLLAAFADDEPAQDQQQQQPAKQAKQKGGKGKRKGGAAAAAAPAQQHSSDEEEEEGEAAPQQGERGPASQRADKLRGESDTPRRAREAIDLGLKKYQAGEFQAALDLFQLSLELPGSGVMRMAGSPKEYSCASEGEENAALYNMACCWAAMGQRQSALTVLEALLENNFEDYASIRSDPDLAPVRGPELDKLLSKYDGLLAKVFGGKKKATSSSGNKPWLQW